MYWQCCICLLANLNGKPACVKCQHKRCNLFCWPKPKASSSEGPGNHSTTTTQAVEASSPATTNSSSLESEDSDTEDEDIFDGYLIATTILSYDKLPYGHTIKKDTPCKACCNCNWCPNDDLEGTQCLDCNHDYCDGCVFVQYVSDAEIEEKKASNGGPTYGQGPCGTAATEDAEVDKAYYDDAESEDSETESEDFFPPLLNLNPVKPVSTHHHMTPANLGITPNTQAPFWECCQCGALKSAARTKCGDCTHPVCHSCQELHTADAFAKIEERKKGAGKGSRKQADAAVDEKRESLHGGSAIESAVMEEALKELAEAIRNLPMGTLMQATIEQKELDTLMWLSKG